MSVSGILEQSCGDAAYEIIPPPVYNPREHLLVPQCDSGGTDAYKREDLLNGAKRLCDGLDRSTPLGPGWKAFQSTENKEGYTHAWGQTRDIKPVPRPGVDGGRYLIIEVNVDLRGCASSMGDNISFKTILSKEECMVAVLTPIDGCK